jgi:hypothetical protein
MSAEMDEEMGFSFEPDYDLAKCSVCGQIQKELCAELVVTEDGDEDVLIACEEYINMIRNADKYEPNKEYILLCSAVVETSLKEVETN